MMKPPTVPRRPLSKKEQEKPKRQHHGKPPSPEKTLTLQELMQEVDKIVPPSAVAEEFTKKDLGPEMFPEFDDLAYKKNMKTTNRKPVAVPKPAPKNPATSAREGKPPKSPNVSTPEFADYSNQPRIEAEELFADEDLVPVTKGKEASEQSTPADDQTHESEAERDKKAQMKKKEADSHFEKRKQMKKERLEAEMREKYSFKPKINEKSKALDSKRANPENTKPRYKNLYELDHVLKVREAELREMVEEERYIKSQAKEEKECTFKPKINSKSLNRDEETDIAERAKAWQKRKEDRLVEVAKSKKERELEGCTFTPVVNKKD